MASNHSSEGTTERTVITVKSYNKHTKSVSKEAALAQRKWHIVDAANVPLGRLASEVAILLRGKHKPTFTPHVDNGDFVIVINAAQVRLTGNKAQDKEYFWHTGYIGGIKSMKANRMLESRPEQVITRAVKGMLRKGALNHQIINKLKVYAAGEHPHSAQQPETYQLGSAFKR